MNDKKITGDILTFKKAFDICSELMDKALKAEDHAGAATLAKAMRLFHEAMEESDAEMEALRLELEAQSGDCIPVEIEDDTGFPNSESLAAFNRSLTRGAKRWGKDEEDRGNEDRRTWNDYVDDHCEAQEKEEQESGKAAREFGDE